MIFGGSKKDYQTSEEVNIAGYGSFDDVFYSLFRLTLVDDYDFDVSNDQWNVQVHILYWEKKRESLNTSNA